MVEKTPGPGPAAKVALLEEARQLAGLSTTIISAPECRADAVFLHGYAMDSTTLAPFAHALRLGVRCLFPRAPIRSEPAGYAWWPVDYEKRMAALRIGPRDLADTHPPGREAARTTLHAFLRAACVREPRPPLVLCGFSQGGMLACDAVLLGGVKVDALILMSSSRVAIDEWAAQRAALRDLPVLVSHGSDDDDLSFAAGEALRDFLIDSGARVSWVPFQGKHEIPLPVWRQMKRFINALVRS